MNIGCHCYARDYGEYILILAFLMCYVIIVCKTHIAKHIKIFFFLPHVILCNSFRIGNKQVGLFRYFFKETHMSIYQQEQDYQSQISDTQIKCTKRSSQRLVINLRAKKVIKRKDNIYQQLNFAFPLLLLPASNGMNHKPLFF